MNNEINNPYNLKIINNDDKKTLSSIKRIDKNGYLYYIDYTSNYYSPLIVSMIKKVEEQANFACGCSAYYAQNDSGENITVRNYDFPHYKSNNKDSDLTGLNVVVHVKIPNKYESIGVADAFWLSPKGEIYNASLDDKKTDITSTILLPYLCMDGINDQGLSASILMVILDKNNPLDKKTTQNDVDKEKISHARLVRYILDNCSNVEEAIELAKRYNIFSLRYSNFQILVTDKYGNSEVLSWRFNEFKHTKTNVVTNFNVSNQLEDGRDVYENDKLIDSFTKLSKTLNEYHYGYGKGFNRFASIVSSLELHAIKKEKNYKTDLSTEEAFNIIKNVRVKPSKSVVSMTQYSLIYNNNKSTLSLYVFGDYENLYNFDVLLNR